MSSDATEPGPGRTRAEAESFGFRRVQPGERTALVRQVFDSVAGRYDLMNDLMSGGIHRLWKKTLIDWLAPRPGMRLVDVAGGTGDVAFGFLERIDCDGEAVVCDLSPAMMEVGRDRALDRGLIRPIRWVTGNAEALPFADRSFDAYTIAFGLRNVTHIDQALAEARRVLRPGGRFLCLEFSHVGAPPLARLYDIYSFRILPALGEIVARDRASYQYLVESIRRFPKADELDARIGKAGLRLGKHRTLLGGIAAIHSAWRI
jgi:demethylmenaquinone methyltransferase / 2-methoxy-6-polyprenyl-1,4-benzoquinol methylase